MCVCSVFVWCGICLVWCVPGVVYARCGVWCMWFISLWCVEYLVGCGGVCLVYAWYGVVCMWFISLWCVVYLVGCVYM